MALGRCLSSTTVSYQSWSSVCVAVILCPQLGVSWVKRGFRIINSQLQYKNQFILWELIVFLVATRAFEIVIKNFLNTTRSKFSNIPAHWWGIRHCVSSQAVIFHFSAVAVAVAVVGIRYEVVDAKNENSMQMVQIQCNSSPPTPVPEIPELTRKTYSREKWSSHCIDHLWFCTFCVHCRVACTNIAVQNQSPAAFTRFDAPEGPNSRHTNRRASTLYSHMNNNLLRYLDPECPWCSCGRNDVCF